jgi:hypothetical protein
MPEFPLHVNAVQRPVHERDCVRPSAFPFAAMGLHLKSLFCSSEVAAGGAWAGAGGRSSESAHQSATAKMMPTASIAAAAVKLIESSSSRTGRRLRPEYTMKRYWPASLPST